MNVSDHANANDHPGIGIGVSIVQNDIESGHDLHDGGDLPWQTSQIN